MKYLHLLVGLIFLLFAYWQLNDPDWYIWLPAYVLVAVLAGWHTFAKPPKLFLLATISGFVLWGLIRIPDLVDWISRGTPSIVEEMKAESPHIELTREFLGIGVCLIVLGIYNFAFHRKKEMR